MDINKVAAINTDAGFDIPDLKQSLAEMNVAEEGRVYTPSQFLVREARSIVGYTQPKFAKAINARLHHYVTGSKAVTSRQVLFQH